MSITGLPGQGPVRVGVPIADLSGGNYAAMGAFIALIERDVSGEGQWVQTSLLQAQIAMLDFQAARWTVAGEVPGQAGNDHPTGIPTGVYPTRRRPHQYRRIGQHIFERCCKALGAEALIKDPDFANGEKRSENRKRLNAELANTPVVMAVSSWWRSSTLPVCPSGPNHSVDQTFADPQVKHVGMAVPISHPTRGQVGNVNQAVALSRTPSVIDRPTPGLGEHTDEVLGGTGYSATPSPTCAAAR